MLYISDNAHLMARHVAKFYGVTPLNPKDIGASTLNYKPVLDPPLKKNCKLDSRYRWGVS